MFKTNTTSFGQIKQDQWIDHIVCKNYKILSEINKGSFGHIFLAVHQVKGDYYAVKIIQTGRNPELASSVRSEAEVLMKLNGSPGFPRLTYFIQDANYSYIVQSLLGKNLYQLFVECDHKFSMKTVLQFLDAAITRLEFLHQNEYIHRDIKPENFMVGLNDNQLYLIDFGFSLKYIEGGKHISRLKTDKMIGTPRFCPNCAHLNIQQNRASDLESLGYLAVYFLKGSLPWMHQHASSKEDKMKVIGQKKLSTSPQELCQGLPPPFEEYFRYINNLQFELAPNYDYCRKLFKKLHHSLALPEDNKFDWIKPDLGSTEDIQQKKAKLFMTVGRKSFTADVSIEELPQTKRTQQIKSTFKVDVSNLFLMTDLREDEIEEFQNGNSLSDRMKSLMSYQKFQ